jgi:hypothetical protein
MQVHPKQTKHQTARGTRPDAARGRELILFKNLSDLRLTYQIRLLTYLASQKGLILSIYLPEDAIVHPDLAAFCSEHTAKVRIIRQ